MATPRPHTEWHNKTWKVTSIHNRPGVGVDDIITFASRAGGPRINSITCTTHGAPAPHGSYWNGVNTTGAGSNKAGGTTNTTGTVFSIESSQVSGKHLLTCDIVSNLPISGLEPDDAGTTGTGACWVAEEQP